jgi:hypothetical protein
MLLLVGSGLLNAEVLLKKERKISCKPLVSIKQPGKPRRRWTCLVR